MIRLPIDDVLPQVVESLRARSSLVLEAPPGAGKTTRVPPAILDAGLAGDGTVLCLQPRRLAARLAATRVAEERGEKPGETVGWQVRFEDVGGTRSRIKFLTEGVLTRRLLNDPDLKGVGAVLLDEFHERHLDGDLALALLRRLQARRPSLKLIVMSATLDAAPVAAWMDAPAIRSEGKRFDVAIEHLEREDGRPLGQQVASAVKRVIAEEKDGDILVFLPGAAEIRRAQEACAEIAARADLLVLPLHGELPATDQDRAVKPAAKRKVILSTNVAETSVTIDGVVAVIDSGFARIASLAPWSGIPVLKIAKVSRASATQRAGRAGRTRAGRCLRLYTKHDHDTRPSHELPEVRRLDLAEAVLSLRASGVDAKELAWLEAPPAGALQAADDLLERLGAFDAAGGVTELGRKMLAFPVHPRQSRLILEAEARGAGEAGCLLAALAGERDVRTRDDASARAKDVGESDLLALRERFEEAERAGFQAERLRNFDLDAGAVMAVARVRDQLVRTLVRGRAPSPPPPPLGRGNQSADDEQALLLATLAAYPDRVAKRRTIPTNASGNANTDRAADLVLSTGGSAHLAPSSVVRDSTFLVAVDIQERRDASASAPSFNRPGAAASSAILVRTASAIEPDWLLDLFPDRVRETVEATFIPGAERVDAVTRLVYDGAIVLDESRARGNEAEIAAALAEAALARGPAAFAPEDAITRLLARVAFVRSAAPDASVPELTDADVRAALRELCEGRRTFAELRDAGLLDTLRARLGHDAARALDKLAPERVTLPGGRAVRIEWESAKPPWIASRLQDFFGMAAGPSVANGRVPVVLHLLAPNMRDLQVTTDLTGFWERHYPAIKRELQRKYPRHSWPDDPKTATPPPPKPPRTPRR